MHRFAFQKNLEEKKLVSFCSRMQPLDIGLDTSPLMVSFCSRMLQHVIEECTENIPNVILNILQNAAPRDRAGDLAPHGRQQHGLHACASGIGGVFQRHGNCRSARHRPDHSQWQRYQCQHCQVCFILCAQFSSNFFRPILLDLVRLGLDENRLDEKWVYHYIYYPSLGS